MDPQSWEKVQELYHLALAIPPHERSAFLKDSAAGDEELLLELRSLLSAEERDLLQPQHLASDLQRLVHDAAAPEHEHYQVLSLLGSGGMGVVYLAVDRRLNRRVALKVLPPAFVHNPSRLARFEREARTASALNHPNIITIHEVGRASGAAFIAAEYVEGRTLRQLMQAGPVPVAQTVRIAAQAAAAFGAAHDAGIIHRDIKPENIMVRPDGLVKVLDFGLARTDTGEPALTHDGRTETGAVMGTPRYMSPEQARGGPLDARSDIFSLAAVIFEMLAGHPAFSGDSQAEVFAALLEKDPAPMPTRLPGVNGHVEAFLLRALSKRPHDRPASMRAFAEEFEQAASRRTPAAVLTLRRRLRPLQRNWRSVAALTALVTLAAAWLIDRNATPAPARTVPFATFAGTKNYPALSPDGTKLAFSWDEGKGELPGIFVRGTTGEPTRISPPGRDSFAPAWSPDGTQLAYISTTRPDYTHPVYIVHATGGPDRQIGFSTSGVSWSPDGQLLAVATAEGSIQLISISSGAHTVLTNPQPAASDSFPEFSPDGAFIAFLRGQSRESRDLFLMPATGGTPRQLTFLNKPITRAVWTSRGRDLVFDYWGDIWRIPSSGGEPRRMYVDAASATLPTISRDGTRMAFLEQYSDHNVWRIPLPPPSAAAPDCLLCSTREDHSASISPDGASIAFVSARSGHHEIWTAARDGSQLRRLTSIGGAATGTPRWSPDGKWLVYDSRPDGYPAIFVIPKDGGRARRITEPSDDATRPSWSADGQWIYFKSNTEPRPQLFKRPVRGGDRVQVTFSGAMEGFEAPGGRFLYFSKDRGEHGLWIAPTSGKGPEQPVPELAEAGTTRCWGVIPSGLYFYSRDDAFGGSVHFYEFATRRVSILTRTRTVALGFLPGLAVSPDRQFVLWSEPDLEVNDIKLVEGFR